MSTPPHAELSSTVLGTPDPPALAGFYRALLGLETAEESSERVVLRPAGGGAGLSFQREEDHVAPTWPPPSRTPARSAPGSPTTSPRRGCGSSSIPTATRPACSRPAPETAVVRR